MPKEPRRSALAMAVLAHLAEAPMHPYRMQQLIKQRAKDTVVNVARPNSLYQTLARLVRDGLSRARETEHEGARPERTVYEITEDGRATLEAWLDEMLSTPANEFPEFPAALAFLAMVPPQRVLERLTMRREKLRKSVSELKTGMQEASEMGLPRLFLLEEEYKLAVKAAEIQWLDDIIADLRSEKLIWSQEWIARIAQQLEGFDQEQP